MQNLSLASKHFKERVDCVLLLEVNDDTVKLVKKELAELRKFFDMFEGRRK